MLTATLSGVRTLTAIGAHPDDIEIGAGGLLLGLPPGVRVHYVLCSGSAQRHAEARQAAAAFLPDAEVTFALHNLPDGRLPGHWLQVKEILEAAAREASPDLVLTPSRNDKHQDHRILAQLAPTAFRKALILQYEIPKQDGDLSRRSVYVPMSPDAARRKVSLLHQSYPSQKARAWWDDEMFLALARIRGMECHTRYAEAFECAKAVIRFT